MRRATLAVCLALLAACTYYTAPGQEDALIVAPGNFMAGSGVIQQVGVLRNANRTATRDNDPNLYRLYLHMDRAGFQAVDVNSSTFMAGEAVELTNDGRVVRVSGTTLNDAARR